MIGLVLSVILGIVVLAGAAAGLAFRIPRAGLADGLLRPVVRVGVWVGVAAAVLAGVLFRTEWSIIIGFFAGVAGWVAALGLDESLDRFATSFYASVRREVSSYFGSVLSWFVLLLFVLFMGYRFWEDLTRFETVTMQLAFGPAAWVVWFLFPLLTMATFAREKAEGTEEVLMTAPVSEVSVVLAKFLGILAFFGVMLVPSLVQFGLLRELGAGIGKPDTGPVLTGYLGMILQGALFASIGLFASSLTSSQILAAILSWMVTIFLLFSPGLPSALDQTGTDVAATIEFLNPIEHLVPFLQGVVAVKDVVYFLSFVVFFLFLTVRVVESRKWR